MRIDSSGNVGINTSPAQIFHVKNTGAHTTWRIENDNADFLIQAGDAGADGLHFYDFDNTAYRMTIANSGNVGIGTTSPSQKLQVTSGNILLDGTDQFIYLSSDADQWLSANAASNYLRIGTGNAERMRIDSAGRVFIGTTSGSERLKVETTANTMVPMTINDSSNTSTLTHRILFSTGGTEVGRIRCTNSGTQYNTSGSDRSMKKNFELWDEDVLSLFKNINPQKFNFIQEKDGATKSKGFIAQELANSFPEAYSKGEEEDDKYWFNPSGMVVYLMKALQEAVARIEALEAK